MCTIYISSTANVFCLLCFVSFCVVCSARVLPACCYLHDCFCKIETLICLNMRFACVLFIIFFSRARAKATWWVDDALQARWEHIDCMSFRRNFNQSWHAAHWQLFEREPVIITAFHDKLNLFALANILLLFSLIWLATHDTSHGDDRNHFGDMNFGKNILIFGEIIRIQSAGVFMHWSEQPLATTLTIPLNSFIDWWIFQWQFVNQLLSHHIT